MVRLRVACMQAREARASKKTREQTPQRTNWRVRKKTTHTLLSMKEDKPSYCVLLLIRRNGDSNRFYGSTIVWRAIVLADLARILDKDYWKLVPVSRKVDGSKVGCSPRSHFLLRHASYRFSFGSYGIMCPESYRMPSRSWWSCLTGNERRCTGCETGSKQLKYPS